MSASVSMRYVGAKFSCAAAMPCFTAHSLPVQLGGSVRLSTTVSRSAAPSAAAARRAISAVPSSLSSSTTTSANAG